MGDMVKRKRSRRILIALFVFWGAVGAWVLGNMQARDVDDSVFESDAAVAVSDSPDTFTFTPSIDTAAVGLLFYPGALVDPEAYGPLARAVAERGYKVVVVKLPFRLAPFERHETALTERTLAEIRNADGRRAWVVGGHSKGGKLAAEFARGHEPVVAGLLLIGTSHPRRADLSGLGLDVAKVYGSEDGLASEQEVQEFAVNLPRETHWIRIEGGNHAQFGWYGWQFGDGRARITREEQQSATVRAIVDQLQRVSDLGASAVDRCRTRGCRPIAMTMSRARAAKS